MPKPPGTKFLTSPQCRMSPKGSVCRPAADLFTSVAGTVSLYPPCIPPLGCWGSSGRHLPTHPGFLPGRSEDSGPDRTELLLSPE